MTVHHDSFDTLYRCPPGPVPAGGFVTLRVRSDADAVSLHVFRDGKREPPVRMKKNEGGLWETVLAAPKAPCLLWYSFEAVKDGQTVRCGAPYDGLGGEGAVYEIGETIGWQVTVYDPAYRTPAFLQGATIYQIFPDRFRRAPTQAVDDRTDRAMQPWDEEMPGSAGLDRVFHAENFYGGTLTGITEKLPYLQTLGVAVLYLNPIFRAHSNHRYDTGDYTRIDPLLGTEEEFRTLCAAAEERGIRILLDGVFSHTGEDSVYFNRLGTYDSVGAAQTKDSPYASWYDFRHWPDDYRAWWGILSLPEVNENDPGYQRMILDPDTGIVPGWLRKGASGWRLDVADELPMDFLRKLRAAAKAEKADAVVLGEVWEDASCKVAYGETRCYCAGDTLDSVMNYPLRAAILDFVTGKAPAAALKRLADHQAEVYPPQFRYALMNLIGSHDRARALNMLCGKEGDGLTLAERAAVRPTPAEYELAARRYRICLDILCALPGCPTVYYGDEAGLTGAPDPFCRKPFPWGREDKALQAYVAAKLNHRRESAVLRYGLCEIAAPDDDTIVIRRTLAGTDALGRPTRETGEEVFTISRRLD